jgi:hypothetical protein
MMRVWAYPDNILPVTNPTAWPPWGPAPLEVDISPNASDSDGTIVQVEYDFTDDGIWDLTVDNTDPVPYTYYGNAVYTFRTRVTDNKGGTGEGAHTISVGLGSLPPGWEAYKIAALGNDFGAQTTLLSSGPAVLIQNSDDSSLSYAFSTSAEPTADSDWTFEQVFPGGVFYSASLEALADEPVVALHDGTAQALVFARRSGGNWTSHVVDDGGAFNAGQSCRIALIDGKPCIGYMRYVDGSTTHVFFARATTPDPGSSSDWVISEILTSENADGPFEITSVNSQPLLVFGRRNAGDFNLGFAYATANPDDSGDWGNYELVADWNNQTPLISLLGGRAAVYYTRESSPQYTRLLRASVDIPTQSDQWDQQDIDTNPGGKFSDQVWGGLPALFYNAASVTLAQSQTADPTSFIDWNRTQLWPDWRTRMHDSVALASGRAALILDNSEQSGIVYYAYELP